MTEITVIETEPARVLAAVDRNRQTFLVDPDRLSQALGWRLGPEGLCRAGMCVPVGNVGSLRVGAQLDLVAVARALGRPVVIDLDAGILAVGLPTEERRRALTDLVAPDFRLPDLDGHVHGLDEWLGWKKVLVVFSSWCGCRYDLPGWQRLDDELCRDGLRVIAVAIDESAEDVAPWTEGIGLPVLYDRQHVLTELYAISNVPTVIWIDEHNRIARPNGTAFASDTFAGFTGVFSGPHLEEIRQWIRQGTVPVTPDEARAAVGDLSDDEVLARLHFRVAVEGRRQGRRELARKHLEQASELAPDDLTVWRAAMPLVDEDPFGEGFLAKYDEWRARGMPYHGLAPVMPAADGTP